MNDRRGQTVLITGGAGFIGTNLADRLAAAGASVVIYDDLSRPGVEHNLAWLRHRHPVNVKAEIADVRDANRLRTAIRNVDQVFHLAAQVAVTTSVADPRHDYEVNVGGTLNVLEAIREAAHPPSLLFTSTNKVYGALTDLHLEKNCSRYRPAANSLYAAVSEQHSLSFHSPYGCSKGAADQYVLDYARTFGIQAVVFRMSCIYGPHQRGTEDQGWIAHFLLQALRGGTITICGDGLQVRDVLFIDDLIDAFLIAQQNIQSLSGHAFNMGGGIHNSLSLVELLDQIEALQTFRPTTKSVDWRIGDQRYYVSDIHRFSSETGWRPGVTAQDGVRRLYNWLRDEKSTHNIPITIEEGHAILSN